MDASRADGGGPDAGALDAGGQDGGDAGRPDAGTDAGEPDAGTERAPYQRGTVLTVEGGELEGEADGDLRRFRGIPYAAPPVGALRLRDPQPVVPWDGTREAVDPPPACPQNDAGGLGEVFGTALLGEGGLDEDCLTLDVTAFDDDRTDRPVMVWIHGGAFVSGAGSAPMYDARELARRGDVVVVTVNYRLGVLGFLATEALAEQPGDLGAGNYGIKDQLAALGWLARNVSAFGGDPSRMTVFGESAGGISICALMGAPSADGAFQQAIVQSGVGCASFPEATGTTPTGQRGAFETSAELLETLGCDGMGADEERACLRAADVDDLVGAVNPLGLLFGGTERSLPVGPYVDGTFMTAQPLARLDSGAVDVPMMLGTTRDEATLFYGSLPIPTRFEAQRRIAEFLGDDTLAGQVMDLYPILRFPLAKQAFLTFVTDFGFACPNRLLLDASEDGAPAFTYEFHKTVPALLTLGAFHALDIPYVFGTFSEMALIPLPSDLRLRDEMQRAWTTFANTGAPATSAGWPTYGEDDALQILDDPVDATDYADFRDGRCDDLAELGL